MSRDTPQQAAVLRRCRTARLVRARFPERTRVTAYRGDGSVVGTVVRHVPGANAQGGYLVIEWDDGPVGRHSAGALRVVAPA